MQWKQAMRVYADWVVMPELADFEYEQSKCFLDACVDLILNDKQLNQPWSTLVNQSEFNQNGEQLLIDSDAAIRMTIHLNNDGFSTHVDAGTAVKPQGIALNALLQDYSNFDQGFNSAAALDIAFWWQKQHCGRDVGFYRDMIASIVTQDIYIEQRSISDYDRISGLLDAAGSRPALQHVLINSLPFYAENIDYVLYLLTTKKFAAVALYLITRIAANLFDNSLINNTTTSLHHVYWPLACDEFLAVTFKNTTLEDNDYLVSLIVQLLAECVVEHKSDQQTTRLDCLNILLEKLTKPQLEGIAEDLLRRIIAGPAEAINGWPFWQFYGLFWLLEKDQVDGVLIGSGFGERVQRAIARSLSENRLTYCGKSGFGHFVRSSSLNSTTIRLKRPQKMPQTGFPSLRSQFSDRLLGFIVMYLRPTLI